MERFMSQFLSMMAPVLAAVQELGVDKVSSAKYQLFRDALHSTDGAFSNVDNERWDMERGFVP